MKFRIARRTLPLLVAACCAGAAQAAIIDVQGPSDSPYFGEKLGWLPNGNFWVADENALSGAGAVYVYSRRGVLLGRLAGTVSTDHVGNGGVFVVGRKLVVLSWRWRGDFLSPYGGAVTWMDGDAPGFITVSATNSLVGDHVGNGVGSGGLTVLANGNVVVTSPSWEPSDTGPQNVGAATWMSAAAPPTGPVSASNSLVGTNADDQVGYQSTIALANGNYVVRSPYWNGNGTNSGAVTWGNGSTGTTGLVTFDNSMYGTVPGQYFGAFQGGSVTPLANGHYVVSASSQDGIGGQKAGAVRWCIGTAPTSGALTSANSLVGGAPFGYVGDLGVRASPNGSFVVGSGQWSSPTAAQAGAVTWSAGTGPLVGIVSAQNSLVGAQAGDRLGQAGGIDVLADGNFVVRSPAWSNGSLQRVGAVTWISATTGRTGVVSTANSVYGGAQDCYLGVSFAALDSGDYVVGSQECPNGGASQAGIAARIAGGATRSGPLGPGNAIVGTQSGESVGYYLNAVPGGDYVVGSFGFAGQGAMAWFDGSATTSGTLTAANAFVGMTGSIFAKFPDGSFVAAAPTALAGAGAVTWFAGGATISGQPSAANSIVGIATDQGTGGDDLGSYGVRAYPTGEFVVISPNYDSAGVSNGGAVTLASSVNAIGTPTPANTVFGTVQGLGFLMQVEYDAAQRAVLVGQRPARRVSILSDTSLSDGFE